MSEVGNGISKAVDKTREGGRSQVIEGPTDHMRDLDLSNGVSTARKNFLSFFFSDLRSRWRM